MPLDEQPPLVDADITRFNPSFFWASGALVSNVDDLDRFYDALFDGRLLPRRLLAEMQTPVDTGAPASATGWAWRSTPCPAGPPRSATPAPCPATTRARSGCSATTRTPAWWPTSTRPGRAYSAFFAAMVELFCGMTPAQATAAARARPGTATEIRFR